MAALQLEPSAQAPWARTMFGRSPIEVSFLQGIAKEQPWRCSHSRPESANSIGNVWKPSGAGRPESVERGRRERGELTDTVFVLGGEVGSSRPVGCRGRYR